MCVCACMYIMTLRAIDNNCYAQCQDLQNFQCDKRQEILCGFLCYLHMILC